MLKSILLLSSLLAISSSYAGVHGGGVMMVSRATLDSRYELLGNGSGTMSSPKIVYNMGETPDSIKFVYGALNGNTWETQKFVLPKANLNSINGLQQALENSKLSSSWVLIKNVNL